MTWFDIKYVSQWERMKINKSYDSTQATLPQHLSAIFSQDEKKPGTHVTLRVLEGLHEDGGHLLYALGHLHL